MSERRTPDPQRKTTIGAWHNSPKKLPQDIVCFPKHFGEATSSVDPQMLEQLRNLDRRPDDELESRFTATAKQILLRSRLMVGDECCRILEIEFYFHSPTHPDPFVHRHPQQSTFGKWYFHRVGSGYRGGSFKGVDVTFGNDVCFGGVLLRTLETPLGVVCGPSLCVDFMLKTTGQSRPESLDAEIGSRDVWDSSSPIFFEPVSESQDTEMLRSARVGLSRKSASRPNDISATPTEFLSRHLRYLIEPRKVTKGRPELIRGMHAANYGVAEIRKLTGSPEHSIRRHISACS